MVVIVPPPLLSKDDLQPRLANARPKAWVRGSLLGIALGLAALFVVARWVNPYDQSGRPLRMETHVQIGLPPCAFKQLFGIPCPSCGMTTSFALLMHGDPGNSIRANAAGTFLAGVLLLAIPWSLVSAWRGRLIGLGSLERAATILVTIFIVLTVVRWLIVVAWKLW